MINFEEMLEQMKVEDFRKLEKFHELVHEALEAEKIIKEVYSPLVKNIVGDVLSVYHYEAYGEYYGDATLSASFLWAYHDNWWGGRDWYVPCTVDGIYELLRNAYLEENNQKIQMCKFIHRSTNTTIYDTAANHFRRFIEETRSKL